MQHKVRETLTCLLSGLKLFRLLIPSHREKVFSVGESGTVVPLLTSAASALGVPPTPAPAMLHTRSFSRW